MYVAFEDQDFLGDFFLIGAFFLYGRPSSRILYVSSLTFIRWGLSKNKYSHFS